MPTYLYEDQCGERHEVSQRITDKAHTHRNPQTGDWFTLNGDAHEVSAQIPVAWRVRRLIAGAPGFTLIAGDSGGWASQGYSKPVHARKAEQTLGRKLHKPV
jgi:hypothetical protein